MLLYFFPLSPYSHKVQMSFIAKNLDYEAQAINPLDNDAAVTFRERYPLGKLPVLKVDDVWIPESTIIVEYLDEFAPEVRLIPAVASGARAVRLIDRLADSYLNDNAIRLFFINQRPEDQRDQQLILRHRKQIDDCYQVLEGLLGENAGQFAHGDRVSLADMSLLPALRISATMVPIEGYANIVAYFEKHRQMPSFKRIDEQAGKALQALKTSGR